MTESGHAQPDAQIEEALRAAGATIIYPETPPIAAGVRARLRTDAANPRQRPWGWIAGLMRRTSFPERAARPWLRDTAASAPPRFGLRPALLVLLALLVATVVISPEIRSAIADRLGLRGVAITYVPGVPITVSRPLGHGLDLGRQTTLEGAQGKVPFRILLPAEIGPPDEVYLADDERVPYVSLAYRARENLPAAAPTAVGLLLAQFRATVDQGVISKGLPQRATIEPATVDGAPGFWISGAPHMFSFQGPDGFLRSDWSRLAGNTLLWERERVTFRLESALSKEQAIRIASSLR